MLTIVGEQFHPQKCPRAVERVSCSELLILRIHEDCRRKSNALCSCLEKYGLESDFVGLQCVVHR